VTTLLPLATYSASGTGASFATDVYRAIRASLSVTAIAGGAATFSLETSSDGTAWRTVGGWDLATEEGESARVFGGLSKFVRVAYVAAGTVEAAVEADLVQVYATPSDFATMGLNTGAFEDVPQSQIWGVLEGASRFVDDYLSARATLPLVVFANASLRRAVVVIATYDLLSSIGYNPEGADENFRLRYLDIIKWLEAIAAGDLPLPGGIQDSTPTAEGAPEVYSDPPRCW